MSPEPGNPLEAEGVLNPGSGRGPDGELYLLPRLVAAGNVSRIGLARINLVGGVPTSVTRSGVVLEPDRSWESGAGHAGVEDPRVTWIAALGVHVMTYVAYGPLGARTAVATSTDLRTWTRHGPVHFGYDDAGLRPEPVPQQGHRLLRRAGAAPDGIGVSRYCTARCGTWTRPIPARGGVRRPGSPTPGTVSGSPSFRCRRSRRISAHSRPGSSTATSPARSSRTRT